MSWPTPTPRHPDSLCSCILPTGCWGAHGWHYRPGESQSAQEGRAYERCPRYTAAVERSGGRPPRRGLR